jgi:hypothetical protein
VRFKPSFTSELPKTSFTEQLVPEPFIRYNNPYDTPTRELEIPAATRFRHVYIAGASQHGKSNLLEHMITQDMESGEGLTLLDPKGDLAEFVINRVPSWRADKCVYIDIKNPIPINFMGWENEGERQTLLADVNQTFMRFSAMAAGDQWGSILRWTIYTLLAARTVSFLDLYYFLADEGRKIEVLDLVSRKNEDGQYDDVFHYWDKTFPKIGKPREGPILTRMSTFITTPPLKKILGFSDRPFDIFEAMEQQMVVIVNLMGVGRENGNLVGALLTSKIQQAAFRRQPQPKEQRVPHHFYADEFQNFQTSDFATMLAEAGGFKVSLNLANQGLYQLDSQIKRAVFTNVTAARIAFRLDHEDLSNWTHLLPKISNDPTHQSTTDFIEPDQLTNLPPYFAFFKIGTEKGVIAPTPSPLPRPSIDQQRLAMQIRNDTLEKYPYQAPRSAQSGPKRTEAIPSCNTSEIAHDEVNASRYEDDTPSPSGAVSMERKQKKSS